MFFTKESLNIAARQAVWQDVRSTLHWVLAVALGAAFGTILTLRFLQ